MMARNFAKIALLSGFLAFAALPVAAAGGAESDSAVARPALGLPEAAVTVAREDGATVLRIVGVISRGLEGRIDAALTALPAAEPVTLELDSPGGFTAVGYRIIDRILEERAAGRAIATRVRAGESCESMCVGIYLAGYPRYAAPTARFMVHAPRLARSGRVTVRSTERMVDRLIALGASTGWIERVREAGGFSGRIDHYETADELAAQKAGVVTDLMF